MITPLKRKKFDELIPAVPTADQYQYYWGNGQDLFRRILISVALLVVFTLIYNRVNDNSPNSFVALMVFVCAALGGMYWMLEPVLIAVGRNAKLRRFSNCGFWQAQVLDVYLSEEVLSKQETVDSRGRLDVSYNTESFFNVELGDRTGFITTIRVPMRREYKRIAPKQVVCMLLFSNDRSFSRISKVTTDAFIPKLNIWISDYPYLRRDVFIDLTRYMFKREQAAVDAERE
ncbi:hypothetical protein V2H45_20885 [Tumidithrix elongata RA019]|uniref:Phosphate ABC transporter permease n=1 Tax=Tumidithrix elongata BACA0141 TaxID=2716417 RepID=A0AAW9Q7K6_9CYAN|nr:hypothetical protein [Tumidithrix elongata RA019]